MEVTVNISSIVIQANATHIEEVVTACKQSDFCDYHFHDASIGKIIVTIEGEGISEEMEKLKKIQAMPHVICADMMMAYSEDELDEERAKLDASGVIPSMLNDDTVKFEDIIYRGDLKKKIH